MSPLLFCGGGYPEESFFETTRRAVVPNRLFTYAYDKRWSADMQAYKDDGCVLMLDSGAFTFYMQAKKAEAKKPLERAERLKRNAAVLEEHTRFVEQHRDRFHIVAALDVLYDPDLTWENYVWQKARVDVFPTWHADSGLHVLKDLITSGAPRIGLGGMAQTGKGKKRDSNLRVLHEVFDMITDAEGRPIVKTHGFAMGSGATVYSFPWTTVDAATAMRAADMGKLLWFHEEDSPPSVRRGDVSQLQLRGRLGSDFKTTNEAEVLIGDRRFSDAEMDVLHHRLNAAGYTLELVTAHYAYRLAFNSMELMKGQALIPATYTRPVLATLDL